MKRVKIIDYWGGKRLSQLLALFVAIALTPSMLLAEDEDHVNGRDKAHDPAGAWLVRFHNIPGDPVQHREFLLIVFHKGGTLTQNIQGDSGFDPSAVPVPPDNQNYGNNVISSPQSGVWQKTGWNTFAGTLLDIEYHNSLIPPNPPDVTLAQFTKEQIIGRLTESGDQMVLQVQWTHFNSDGQLIEESGIQSFQANGVRVPLEILPHSENTLPVPQPPK